MLVGLFLVQMPPPRRNDVKKSKYPPHRTFSVVWGLACSRRSDSGERCKVKRSPSPVPLYFSSLSLLRTALHYLSAWNRLFEVLIFLKPTTPSKPIGQTRTKSTQSYNTDLRKIPVCWRHLLLARHGCGMITIPHTENLKFHYTGVMIIE